MADIAVTPVTLVSGVASVNTTDAAGGASIAAAATNVWAIAIGGVSGDHVLLKFLGVAGTTTITILAGVRPPSQRAGLGNLTLAVASGEVKYVVVETARFLQTNGTIRASVNAGDTTRCAAFILPKVH
jgi:hypothetical protein